MNFTSTGSWTIGGVHVSRAWTSSAVAGHSRHGGRQVDDIEIVIR